MTQPWVGRRAAMLPAVGALTLPILPAWAEVRSGPGVRIGGRDFPNRRTGSVHVERVKRRRGPLGCRRVRRGMYRRGDGSVVRGPVEECNLIAKPHREIDPADPNGVILKLPKPRHRRGWQSQTEGLVFWAGLVTCTGIPACPCGERFWRSPATTC